MGQGTRPSEDQPIGALRGGIRADRMEGASKRPKVDRRPGLVPTKNPEKKVEDSFSKSRDFCPSCLKRKVEAATTEVGETKLSFSFEVVSPHGGRKQWKKVAQRTQSESQTQEGTFTVLSKPEVPKVDRLFAKDKRYELTSSKGISELAEAAEQPRHSL